MQTETSIQLIVRADDMGVGHDANLAIARTYDHGIVTSASLMPTAPYFEEAVALCRARPALNAGLHITLLASKLRPVLPPEEVPDLVTPAGFFHETIEELLRANPRKEQIEREVRAQLERGRASGLRFVYLDWHRNATDATKEIMIRLCREEGLVYAQDKDGSLYGYRRIPFIPESWPRMTLPDGRMAYLRSPALSEDQRRTALDRLEKLAPGGWMMVAHPALLDPQRADVTALLCSDEVREIVRRRNIQLVGYDELLKAPRGKD